MNNKQIPLGFTVRDYAEFASFYAPSSLRLVKSTLQKFVNEDMSDFVYLSGIKGTGKSHLLQAICHLADKHHKPAMYFSLLELKDYPPADILEATEYVDFLCLDDIDAIAGNTEWEEALFHLFNQRNLAQKPTFFAAVETANKLPVHLADLKSRLASCLAFQLPLLNDVEKTALIQYRAIHHGMEIDETCAQFIIKRSGRNIENLVEVVERLDQESLSAVKKITIPFIKQVFNW